MKHKLLGILLVLALIFILLPTTAMAAFSDTSSHWAEEAIDRWSSTGIIQGYDGQFHPNDPITRADMAVILDRLMQYETAANNTYPDLPDDAYYTTAVLHAREAGVMFGDGAYMRPMNKITRQEAVVMLGRAFGLPESNTAANYSDLSGISAWALGYVNSMTEIGLIQGYNGMFNPKANMTRAEVVTVLDNMVFGLFTYVQTSDELEAAIESGAPAIAIMDTIGSPDSYKAYEIDHPVLIVGGSVDSIVYGSFRIQSDGVMIDGLTIHTRGGSGPMHSAVDVIAKQVTITNNIIELNAPVVPAGGSVISGVTIWPYGNAETNFDIIGNTFRGFETAATNWTLTAMQTVEGFDLDAFGMPGVTSRAANIGEEAEMAMSRGNTYDGFINNYIRTDWSTGSPVYKFAYASTTAQLNDAMAHIGHGARIFLAEGTYNTAISLYDKWDIRIVGSGKDTVIEPTELIDTNTTYKATTNIKAAVFVNDCPIFKLENLTISGGGLSPDAIVLWNNTSGYLVNVSITDSSPLSGAETGYGIAVKGYNASLNINDSSISGFNRNGIDVGDGARDLKVVSSSITGRVNNTVVQNGVVFQGETSGWVVSTVFTNLRYTGNDGSKAWAVFYGTANNTASLRVDRCTYNNVQAVDESLNSPV